MRTCPNCRQPVEDDQTFCPSCMSPITHIPNIVAVCRFCGKPLDPETRCCTGCGRSGDAIEDSADRWKTGPLFTGPEVENEAAPVPAAPAQPVKKTSRAVPAPPAKKPLRPVPTPPAKEPRRAAPRQENEVTYVDPSVKPEKKRTVKKWLPILLSVAGGTALAVALILLVPTLTAPKRTETESDRTAYADESNSDEALTASTEMASVTEVEPATADTTAQQTTDAASSTPAVTDAQTSVSSAAPSGPSPAAVSDTTRPKETPSSSTEGPTSPQQPQSVSVANVVGKTQEEAFRTLYSQGFGVNIESTYSSTVAKGKVVKQQPASGTLKPGAIVTIYISEGPEPPTSAVVANVVGKTQSDAVNTLQGQGFTVIVEPVYSDSVAKGRVVRQQPASGSLKLGASVTIQISNGPKPADPPTTAAVANVVGKTQSDAVATLQGQGFSVTVESTYSSSVAKGKVVSQQPASGTLKLGASVTIYVSNGPQPVTVSFNANGGTAAYASKSVTPGETYGDLPFAAKDYCNFEGWYTSDGTRVTPSARVSSTGSHTLTARWTDKPNSGWVRESAMPAGAMVIDAKYTYTVHETKTTGSASEAGWIQSGKEVSGWSDWQGPVTTKPTDASLDVKSEEYTVSTKTLYKYSRYISDDKSITGPTKGYWGLGEYKRYCGNLEETKWLDRAFNNTGAEGKYQKYKDPKGEYKWTWYNQVTQKEETKGTRWYYREPVYSYSYYRDVDGESASLPGGATNVVKWVIYRER